MKTITCDGDFQIYSGRWAYCPSGQISEGSDQLDQLNTVLNEIYSFDLDIFGVVMGSLIVAFITGHWAGKVARILGRT